MAVKTRGGDGRHGARLRRLALACGLALSATLLGGCETDSYLDPSVLGRWEQTPTTVPILNHLAIVEDAEQGEVAFSDVEPRDLIPEPEAYRASPGDTLEVTIFGLFQPNEPSVFQARIDQRGYISLPQIGEVFVRGMSREEAQQAIATAAEERQIISDPIVAITPLSERERTYSLIGAVRGPGTYTIPESDYRLLEALAAAGGIGWPDADYVYVIRQVPLSEEAAGQTRPAPREQEPVLEEEGEQPDQAPPEEPGDEDLLEILDEIGQPPPVRPGQEQPEQQPEPQQPGGGAPGAFDASVAGSAGGLEPLVDLDALNAQPEDQPDVDLPDQQAEEGITWVYRDGRWVMVRRRQPGEPGAEEEAPVVTQRVIRVPVARLISGDARVNMVVRPGDVIRIPNPPQGVIFMRGFVGRPGTYGLTKKLTLTRAIDAAGGLGGLAIPERVDIVRMLPGDRQAWVRVNLRAIEDGTQPDIYLKANDRVNVGTNFWALPLAVVRGGLRASYGFGFLLDRNFGNDVFGAPPTNVQGR